MTVNEPPDLQAEFEITSNICDDQVDGCLTVSGGTMPYNVFVWYFPSPSPTDPDVQILPNGEPLVDGQVATNDIPFGPIPFPTEPYIRCAENIPAGIFAAQRM